MDSLAFCKYLDIIRARIYNCWIKFYNRYEKEIGQPQNDLQIHYIISVKIPQEI